ncbi:MAG: zinc ribbon domain-containing protein [Acidobacteria bacterium]|nr:zinc ribbon domain-containing protein [Acidobacteriota bacterium]MCA1637838.1 zinc ribbon domain-containing protein [Acidobacteriota bacterium]
MYCPRCGQEQVSSETKFCSRCGFLLTGVLELIYNNGLSLQTPGISEIKGISPRKKGLKQGGQLLFLCLMIVPIIGIISAALNFNPAFFIITGLLTFWGGVLRMLYARIFESNEPSEESLKTGIFSSARKLLNKKQKADTLPPNQSPFDNPYVPPVTNNWRDTNDLIRPSVTDHTTKLLEKDK